MVTYARMSSKVVNSRDIAGNAEERKEIIIIIIIIIIIALKGAIPDFYNPLTALQSPTCTLKWSDLGNECNVLIFPYGLELHQCTNCLGNPGQYFLFRSFAITTEPKYLKL